jgi:hypothetical protein
MKEDMIRLKPALVDSIRNSYKGVTIPKGDALMLWDTDGTVIGAILPTGIELFLMEQPEPHNNAYGEILCLTTIGKLTGYLPVMCGHGGSGWLCLHCADSLWTHYLVDQKFVPKEPTNVVVSPLPKVPWYKQIIRDLRNWWSI